MENHTSDAIKIVVGIIVGLAIISFVVVAVTQALKLGNKGLTRTTNLSTTIDEQQYTQYDGEVVLGDQVIGIIKAFANDTVAIIVDNGNGEVVYNWKADLSGKSDASIANAETKGNSAYINPSTKFVGSIVRSDTTDAITAIKFTKKN